MKSIDSPIEVNASVKKNPNSLASVDGSTKHSIMRIIRRVGLCLWTEEDCSWHMLRCVPMFHNKCIQTWKASCKSEPNNGVCPQCRKPFRKLLFNYKQRGTLPRHHAKAQLMPWAGQHIGNAGTSSIHLFSNYTLIPCTKALYKSTTSLHHLSYTWLPICFSSTCDMQFLLYLPFRYQFY